MTRLAQTQHRFQRHVIDEAGADASIFDEIAGPDAQFCSARLDIYREGYRLRLIEALAQDYGSLKSFLGDQMFDALACDYIAARPSVYRNLRWFGEGMAQFLRSNARYAPHGVLADLAQFEWTLGLAFDAADAPTLAFEQLAAIALEDWPRVTLHAHPSLHLVRPRWNVTAIWHAIDGGTEVPPPVSGEPTPIVVWRAGLSPHFRSLDAEEAALWQCLSSGATFAQGCEVLAARIDAGQAPQTAAGLLRRWVDDGWLTRFELAG